MNKSVILNCKDFKCRFNAKGDCENKHKKGDCKLSHVSLASDGSPIVGRLICEDAEPILEEEP